MFDSRKEAIRITALLLLVSVLNTLLVYFVLKEPWMLRLYSAMLVGLLFSLWGDARFYKRMLKKQVEMNLQFSAEIRKLLRGEKP
jgi:hypothetical protein